MEIFRGDTFYRELVPNQNYKFQKDDIIKVAVMVNTDSENHLFDDTITVEEESEKVDILIPPEKTARFEIGDLILEIEVTYGGGIVKTQQYILEVKEDGIHE